MKLPAILNTKAVTIGAGVLVGGVVLYFIGRAIIGGAGEAGKKAADYVARINEGTPYEGTGPVGTLGHGVDVVSGGALSTFGGWLGRKIYDITHPGDA